MCCNKTHQMLLRNVSQLMGSDLKVGRGAILNGFFFVVENVYTLKENMLFRKHKLFDSLL